MTKWSSLRRIGQSRVVALTTLVPILGFIIGFNKEVVDLMTLAPEVVQKILQIQIEPESLTRAASLNRLYFLYCGLCLVGFASFVFIVCCPNVIKNHDNPSSYYERERDFMPAFRARNMVQKLVETYLYRKSLGARISYSDSFMQMFERFFDQIAHHIQMQDDEALKEAIPNSEAVIRALASKPGSFERESIITLMLQREHTLYCLRINYELWDTCRLIFRICCASLYVVGFLVLFIPTMQTLYRIALELR
jgi:hypothetical protein